MPWVRNTYTQGQGMGKLWDSEVVLEHIIGYNPESRKFRLRAIPRPANDITNEDALCKPGFNCLFAI